MGVLPFGCGSAALCQCGVGTIYTIHLTSFNPKMAAVYVYFASMILEALISGRMEASLAFMAFS